MHLSRQSLFPILLLAITVVRSTSPALCQTSSLDKDAEIQELRESVRDLAQRVAVLEEQVNHKTPTLLTASAAGDAATTLADSVSIAGRGGATRSSSSAATQSATVAESPKPATPANQQIPWQLPGGATLNFMFDGYYEFDFNHPLGRVLYLRAYDVLSNAFSINQADVVYALDPDVANGRRYGVRLDLQFGQATETLQGNSINEPRPEIYRNIFQAYGTYVFPVGRGLTVDFGKWASSIGIEGNYTKDQMNYTRSFFFDFLPFYHAGVRANYKLNDKLAFNYWIVNGIQQSEPTNSFKDQLFGLEINPSKKLAWTVNYYLGQDHPDSTPATDCGTAPVQPGLCLAPIIPAPNGKTHIFDSYATWTPLEKWTFALEGDYVIEREWANAGPGMSSAPSHVDGGAAYAHYQWSPKTAFAVRSEYLADRGGLYSGTTQDLKEITGTYEYKLAEGFLTRLEYRRDWSNVPFFLTDKPGVLSKEQPTVAVGLVWWYGGKQGAW
jgi:Putative beta-barrel porin-2, OmpL-like. bbp2